jgi:hypothetical protein
MASIEDAVAPYLREVVLEQRLLSNEHLGKILSLAALIGARDRRMRAGQQVTLANSLKEYLRSRRIPREKWERIRASEIAAGSDPQTVPDYEAACELACRDDWMPVAPHVVQIGMIPDLQAYIVGQLTQRRWELVCASKAVPGGFIASDSPLVWGRLDDLADMGRGVPLDGAEEVTFPLSKALALVSYEGARGTPVRGSKQTVGHVNMRTLQLMGGLVLHADTDFLLRRRSGEIAMGSDYMRFVRQARASGIINP